MAEKRQKQERKKITPANTEVLVTGLVGFEPTDDGVRVRCLTVWR